MPRCSKHVPDKCVRRGLESAPSTYARQLWTWARQTPVALGVAPQPDGQRKTKICCRILTYRSSTWRMLTLVSAFQPRPPHVPFFFFFYVFVAGDFLEEFLSPVSPPLYFFSGLRFLLAQCANWCDTIRCRSGTAFDARAVGHTGRRRFRGTLAARRWGGVVGGTPGWSQTTGESTFHERRRKSFLHKLCLPYVFSSPRQQRTCNRRCDAQPRPRDAHRRRPASSSHCTKKKRTGVSVGSRRWFNSVREIELFFFFLIFPRPSFFFSPRLFCILHPLPLFSFFPPNILCGGRANKVVP